MFDDAYNNDCCRRESQREGLELIPSKLREPQVLDALGTYSQQIFRGLSGDATTAARQHRQVELWLLNAQNNFWTDMLSPTALWRAGKHRRVPSLVEPGDTSWHGISHGGHHARPSRDQQCKLYNFVRYGVKERKPARLITSHARACLKDQPRSSWPVSAATHARWIMRSCEIGREVNAY